MIDKRGSHKGKGRRRQRNEEEEECLELEKTREIKKAANSDGSAEATRNLKTKRGSNDNGPFPSSPGLCFKTRVGDQQCK